MPSIESDGPFLSIDRYDSYAANFDLGAAIVTLIGDWSRWVHRRTEEVDITDSCMRPRRVTIEFTLPRTLKHPGGLDLGPVHYVPLTTLHKRRITNLSLIDESNAQMPILTQHLSGAVGTAALTFVAKVAYATRASGGTLDEEALSKEARAVEIPPMLLKLIGDTAALRRSQAVEAWKEIRDAAENPDSPLSEWATRLVEDQSFKELALELANAYLIVTPVPAGTDRRRVLTLSYEESSVGTPVHLSKPRQPEPAADASSKAAQHNLLRARDQRVEPYHIFSWKTLASKSARIPRWTAKPIHIPALSVGRGECYHMEVIVPEGLQATRAVLAAYDPTAPYDRRIVDPDWWVYTSQRAHVHLADVPQSYAGSATVCIRPRNSAGVRIAMVHAGIIACTLFFLALFWSKLENNPSLPLTLLLAVAGFLSLYSAHSRGEADMTTEVLFGIRAMSFLSAVAAFVAAGIVAAGRTCTQLASGDVRCEPWNDAGSALWIVFGAAGVVFLALAVTVIATQILPEQRVKPRDRSHRASGGAPRDTRRLSA